MLASHQKRLRFKAVALALLLSTLLPAYRVSADELPLTLTVLNYQAFNGPDLQSYMMRTKEQIRAHWHPSSNQPRTAKVFFQIFADGSLLQHEIEKSSGDKTFDDEAKAVIVSCVPYPPPPPGNVRLINVVATFGANPGASAVSSVSGNSSYVGTPNLATVPGPGVGEENAGSNTSNLSASGGAYGSSETSGTGGGSGSAHAPLLGTASESGMMQTSTSSDQPPTKFLQGEVGAAGFANQPMQGQAMASAPPMFQSQMPMQAPMQGGAQRQFLQADASHGAMTIGVLGCEFGLMNGQIRQILPGSDLLRYGIQPGDIIEAADGQRLRGRALQAYTRGTPGTYVQLTILHQGQIATFPIQRKDARVFSNYNGYFKKWAAQEKFW